MPAGTSTSTSSPTTRSMRALPTGEATEQNQVAPEAADDVDEVIRIAGTIQELLAPTATPTPTPAPTETPASSATATATPEASATTTTTPESSPGPGAAGGETIIPLTPTPSP